MKRTVLIPTDFTIESLNLLKYAAQSAESESINLVLAHGLHLSDSIFDLLFFSRTETVEKLLNEDFEAAGKILRNKYASRINSFRIEIFSGFTQSAFQNFLSGNRVTEILLPKTYSFKAVTQRSFDLAPFARASKYPVKEVDWQAIPNAPEKNKLAEVFLI
ncbi:MAG: hypothetical protein KIT62_00105 [Cyclobacteriaceae bacterium]|nr:hypothetical protein [Cyclobacteriaceae bacterium]